MKASIMMAVGLAIALTGCTAQQQSASQAKARQVYSSAPDAVRNAYLTAAVATKLAVVDADSATNVRASADSGIVTLSGQARNAAERSLYVKTAKSVSGVVAVQDMLSINPHLQGLRDQAADVTLETRVSAAIAAQAGVNVFHVQTSVRNGIVTLRGNVPSRSVDRTILNTVRAVSGVKMLVDLIAVRS